VKFLSNFFSGLSVIALIGYFVVLFAGIYGYVMNIVEIAHTMGGPMTTMFIVRIVGCFAFPLGAILGYF
jgi:hypothetical protein